MLRERHFYNFFQQLLGETKGVYSSTNGAEIKRSDTVGEPRILVFIVLIRNSGQERRGEDPLPEREALTSCHISEDRLFLRIYYIKYSCSKKYI